MENQNKHILRELSIKNLRSSRCHGTRTCSLSFFLCKNPAVFVPKILGFFWWLSAKKLKRQFVSRARSAPQIFLRDFVKKHVYSEKQKKDVSGAAVELHSEIFMRSSIEGIRGFCKAKPQDSYFIKMLSRVIQSMRSGSPFFLFFNWNSILRNLFN